jgi:hypothetical protein
MLAFLWAAGAASVLSATPVSSDANPPPFILSGRCTYPISLGAAQVGETRILCDSVAVRSDGADTIIEFSRKFSDRWIRFSGEMSGSRMTVRRVYPSWDRPAPARGACTIFHKDDRVSAVSCVAQVGGRSFVANLLPPPF